MSWKEAEMIPKMRYKIISVRKEWVIFQNVQNYVVLAINLEPCGNKNVRRPLSS